MKPAAAQTAPTTLVSVSLPFGLDMYPGWHISIRAANHTSQPEAISVPDLQIIRDRVQVMLLYHPTLLVRHSLTCRYNHYRIVFIPR